MKLLTRLQERAAERFPQIQFPNVRRVGPSSLPRERLTWWKFVGAIWLLLFGLVTLSLGLLGIAAVGFLAYLVFF